MTVQRREDAGGPAMPARHRGQLHRETVCSVLNMSVTKMTCPLSLAIEHAAVPGTILGKWTEVDRKHVAQSATRAVVAWVRHDAHQVLHHLHPPVLQVSELDNCAQLAALRARHHADNALFKLHLGCIADRTDPDFVANFHVDALTVARIASVVAYRICARLDAWRVARLRGR